MRSIAARILLVAGIFAVAAVASDSQAVPPSQRGLVWAGCQHYNTFGTPATFSPTAGSAFDRLFKNPAGFKDGIGAISDAAPGYGDYNGGRWEEMVLKPGVDGSKYSNACSVDDLDMNDFMPSGAYFECPLHMTN